MSNFRLLVHPLPIDFGGGSSSCSWCCCSCWETKSTPSPKTDVWTLDLGLEFDKIVALDSLRELYKLYKSNLVQGSSLS